LNINTPYKSILTACDNLTRFMVTYPKMPGRVLLSPITSGRYRSLARGTPSVEVVLFTSSRSNGADNPLGLPTCRNIRVGPGREADGLGSRRGRRVSSLLPGWCGVVWCWSRSKLWARATGRFLSGTSPLGGCRVGLGICGRAAESGAPNRVGRRHMLPFGAFRPLK
jgi:hypothetical protein